MVVVNCGDLYAIVLPEEWHVPRTTCTFTKRILMVTRLLLSNIIENMNNIFYCSVKPTYVSFLVLILNSHKLLAAALILALHSSLSSQEYVIRVSVFVTLILSKENYRFY